MLVTQRGNPFFILVIKCTSDQDIRVCQKTRFFKELRDHLDYHFYWSEWETCKKLGLYDDFLVRGIRIEDIH